MDDQVRRADQTIKAAIQRGFSSVIRRDKETWLACILPHIIVNFRALATPPAC